MSMNFLTHIRSVEDPVDVFPGILGCCCGGTGEPTIQYFSDCMKIFGYFYPADDSDLECSKPCLPQGVTGCCCSCFYGGMTEGIERSLCEDMNGKWREGPCNENENAFCLSNLNVDVRIPKKCCGFTLANGAVTPICIDVCTECDCQQQSVPGNYVPVFYPSTTCELDNNCPQVQGLLNIQNNYFLSGNIQNDTYGNCCIQGKKCRCLSGISYTECSRLNGAFYRLEDQESSCADCLANCTNGEF